MRLSIGTKGTDAKGEHNREDEGLLGGYARGKIHASVKMSMDNTVRHDMNIYHEYWRKEDLFSCELLWNVHK